MNRKNMLDDFGTEDTYKLYRTIYEIIHPTISKKNISNYKIILQEDLIPLRIFYPKKISKLEKAVIYIPGKSWIVNGIKNYSEVAIELSKKLDSIIIAFDYELETNKYMKTVNQCYETLKYLIEGLNRVGIEKEAITVIGDSTGASILANVCMKEEQVIPKLILLYPALNLMFEEKEKYPSLQQNNKLDLLTLNHLLIFNKNYLNKDYKSPLKAKNYDKWPNTLIITSDLDPVRDEGIELANNLKKVNKKSKGINITFASHGFLNSKDEETKEEAMMEIKKFISKK